MMVRFLVPFALCCCLGAQEASDLFSKAPPEVDSALRARITQFFQAHVDGKFRQAEALVAEDTKEFFYEANKPRYLSFAIQRIEYSDNFTKAKAVVLADMVMPFLGFADKPMKVPLPSYWKIENNDWYWWVDPEVRRRTPFGTRSLEAQKAGGSAEPPARLPAVPQGPEAYRALWNGVKVDKSNVSVVVGATAELLISNGLPGPVSLSLARPARRGLVVKFDPAELRGGTTARVLISATDAAVVYGASSSLLIRVQPTNQLIPIAVKVASR